MANRVFNTVILVLVGYNVHNRLLGEELLDPLDGASLEAEDSGRAAALAVTRKLQQFVGIFIFIWAPALVNRIVVARVQDETTLHAFAMLHVACVPLQGFLNAIVSHRVKWRAERSKLIRLGRGREVGEIRRESQRSKERWLVLALMKDGSRAGL